MANVDIDSIKARIDDLKQKKAQAEGQKKAKEYGYYITDRSFSDDLCNLVPLLDDDAVDFLPFQRRMRLAIVHKDRCHAKKCAHECIIYCPRVRTGDETVTIGEATSFSRNPFRKRKL